ncbi:hypothetical protein ACFSVM_08070 [Paenibacillus shunpengii]|uniref:Uncharacterized protein n=1 Tax=Paenibacillus shunpengii TaxID=2054424 RepID=A0ABW5SLY2_9BACL
MEAVPPLTPQVERGRIALQARSAATSGEGEIGVKKRSVRICPWILTIKMESEESKDKKARASIRH